MRPLHAPDGASTCRAGARLPDLYEHTFFVDTVCRVCWLHGSKKGFVWHVSRVECLDSRVSWSQNSHLRVLERSLTARATLDPQQPNRRPPEQSMGRELLGSDSVMLVAARERRLPYLAGSLPRGMGVSSKRPM